MKNNKLFLAITACTASLLLAACGGNDGNTSAQTSSVTAADADSSTADTARVSMGVRFPQSEATAAWVGDRLTVEVRFYLSLASDWNQAQLVLNAYDGCDSLDDPSAAVIEGYSCATLLTDDPDTTKRGELAGSLEFTQDSSTGYLDLEPGNYRVEASFYDDAGTITETSVSYAVLDAGAHTLILRGYSASWSASSTIRPQLLGSPSLTLSSDWDMDSDGEQSLAAALGIADGIDAVHLATLTSWPEGWDSVQQTAPVDSSYVAAAVTPNEYADVVDGVGEFSELSESALYVSVLESSQGEMIPPSGSTSSSTATNTDGSSTLISSHVVRSPATVMQWYLDGENSLGFQFSSASVTTSTTVISADLSSYQTTGVGGGYDFGVYNSTDDNTYYEVTDAASSSHTYWNESQDDWATESLTLLEISSHLATDIWKDIYTSLAIAPTAASDGSTLTGYFIERLYSSTTYAVDATSSTEAMQPPAYFNAALEAIAVDSGLVAAAVDGCESYEGGGWQQGTSTYKWDSGSSHWVGGTYNTLLLEGGVMTEIDTKVQQFQDVIDSLDDYNLSDEQYQQYLTAYQYLIELHDVTYRNTVLALADMNGDGTAELFESGVYIVDGATQPSCELTETQVDGGVEHGMNCDQFTVGTTIDSTVYSESGTICAQSFTMTASNLEDLSAVGQSDTGLDVLVAK
ncbi:hypothetical protein [Oceanobacter mangrovi]|uniref:hypothetical protein n=1 Tax=Oceanobacter mangrovi TaxID=2862510 RepID=UPI001C8E6BCF|nr:hypothetical protein [Oceanobacter mangrovi]